MPGDIAGGPSPGDEPDGFVGIADLNRVLGFWNQTCTPGDWTKGDISGDGEVGIEDLNIVLGHWNQSDPDPFLGTNVGPLVYWKSHWAFVDVMKMARPWLTTDGSTFNTGLTVPVDADGWPTENPSGQTVFTHVLIENGGAYPGGDYILTWEGNATVTPDLNSDIDSYTEDLGNPRRMTVTVMPGNAGIRINIDNIDTTPGQHIKNIRLWMPGFEDAQSPFHPLFLSRLRPFKVLRFMDWQKINDSDEVDWDTDRKQPTDAFQNDNTGGVALEYMVQLCNELGADPWFCMPAKADDNYVTQFAQYVRDNLEDPDATIYVEYSNELWNAAPTAGFTQFQWLVDQANIRLELDPDDPDDQERLVHVRDDEWFHQWAIESTEDFGIWETAFANDPQNRQIVRVVAGQKTNVWIMQKLIPWMLDPDDPNGKDVLFDAIACSTYFYSKTDGIQTVEGVLDNTLNKIQTEDKSDYDDYALEVRKLSDPNHPSNKYTGRTIPLISYEGGQHYIPLGKRSVNPPSLA